MKLGRIAVVLSLALFASGAFAQAWPTKPIRLVVPFPPGGGTDVVARTVVPTMSEVLGQNIFVDNRAGAGGNLGAELAAKAPADGYTLLLAASTLAINYSLMPKLSWNVTKDFDPIVLLVMNQSLLLVHPSVPASSVQELIALAKLKPGSFTYASSGNGSGAHLAGELFKLMAGVNLVHVPYKGAAPALTDLVGGHVDVMLIDIAAAMPYVASGKAKALGIGSPHRFERLPDVPTISESGVPGYEISGFLGLAAPAGTPREVIQRLNAAALKSLETPEVRERLRVLATIPVGGPPERFAEIIRADIEKYGRVVRAGNLKAE